MSCDTCNITEITKGEKGDSGSNGLAGAMGVPGAIGPIGPTNPSGWTYDGNTVVSEKYFGTNDNFDIPLRTNNVVRGVFNKLGNFGFGESTVDIDTRVHIKGFDSTSSFFALKIKNSSNTPLLYVRNDGNVGIGESIPLARLSVLTEDNLITSYGVKIRQNVSGNDLFYIKGNGYSAFTEQSRLGIGDNTSSNSRVNIQGVSGASASDNQLIVYNYGGSVASFIIKENSNVGVGKQDQTPTARLHIQGISSTSTDYALKVDNSSNTPLLYVRNDGRISAPLMQTGNAGLVSGDLYVDTAANILANGDKVVGRKV